MGLQRAQSRIRARIGTLIVDGTLETERLAGLDDDEVAKTLTGIRGLGPVERRHLHAVCFGPGRRLAARRSGDTSRRPETKTHA